MREFVAGLLSCTGWQRRKRLSLQRLPPLASQPSWKARMGALEKLARQLPAASWTRRHLKGSCFRCGADKWKTCQCKSGWQQRQPQQAGSSSSLGSSSRVVLPVKAPARKAMKAMKRDRSHRDRRGEKSFSGATKRKMRGITSDHDDYKRLKWGREPVASWRRANHRKEPMRRACTAALRHAPAGR